MIFLGRSACQLHVLAGRLLRFQYVHLGAFGFEYVYTILYIVMLDVCGGL